MSLSLRSWSREPVAPALLVFLAALPVSIALMNVGAGLVSAALAVECLRRRRLPWDHAWDAPLLGLAAYCLCGLLAAALSPEPALSLREASKDIHRLWVAALALLAFRAAPRARAELAFAAGFSFVIAVGFWEVAFLPTGFQAWERARGFVHAVTYGQQMALAFLGALCLALRPGPARRWAALFMPFCAGAILLSQTRAAILGVAAGAAALAACYPPVRRRLPAVILASVAVLAIWEAFPSATGGRSLLKLRRPAAVAQGNIVDPHQARWVLWDASWKMFRSHPAAGIGPGRFRAVFPDYFTGTLDNERAWGSAHNLYFHQLAERGLLGIIGLAAAFGALGWAAWRRARGGGTWALCGWATLAAFAAMNMTEAAFQNEQISALFLTLWAAGMSREP